MRRLGAINILSGVILVGIVVALVMVVLRAAIPGDDLETDGDGMGQGITEAESRIAFVAFEDGDDEIYTMKPDGSGMIQLTHNEAPDERPIWSPDGTRIAFLSRRDGPHDLYVMNADGSSVVRLTDSPGIEGGWKWSPDGAHLAFVILEAFDYSEMFMVDAAGGSEPELLGRGREVAWSPDGTRLAYIADDAALAVRHEVMVLDLSTREARSALINGWSGWSLAWSPDGTRLSFLSGDPADSVGETLFLATIGADDAEPFAGSESTPGAASYWWSPRGSYILFYKIEYDGDEIARKRPYVINMVQGGDPIVMPPMGDLYQVSWSSDETRFAVGITTDAGSMISLINVDGSGYTQIGQGMMPDWSPVPGITPQPTPTLDVLAPDYSETATAQSQQIGTPTPTFREIIDPTPTPTLTPLPSDKTTFIFHNATANIVVCGLQISLAMHTDWGDNLLTGDTLLPGESITLTRDPGGYDIRAQDCGNQDVFSEYSVGFSLGEIIRVTLRGIDEADVAESDPGSVESTGDWVRLIFNNASTETVCYLYISPTTDEVWGDALLEWDTIPPGESYTLTWTSGSNDILAEDCSLNTVDEMREIVFLPGRTYTITLNGTGGDVSKGNTVSFGEVPLRVLNVDPDNEAVWYVYVRRAYSETWGDDVLGDQHIVQAGEELTVSIPHPHGIIEMMAADSEHNVLWWELGTQEIPIGMSLEFAVIGIPHRVLIDNQSSLSICGVYVSRITDPQGSSNLVHEDYPIEPDTSRFFMTGAGSIHVTVETCDEATTLSADIEVSGETAWTITDSDLP